MLKSNPESERVDGTRQVNMECGELPNETVLGVYWFTDEDCFRFKIQVKEKPYTRREVLSVTSPVYDPVGIVSPFVLTAKLLLQDCANEN